MVAFFSCSKSGGDVPQDNFTLEGTVYVDQVPTVNVTVEFGRKDTIYDFAWDETTRLTDSDGKYSFSFNTGSGARADAQYRIRAKNPLNEVWSNYKMGGAPPGQTIVENFNFSAGE